MQEKTNIFRTRVDWWIILIILLVGLGTPAWLVIAIVLEWVQGLGAMLSIVFVVLFGVLPLVIIFFLSYFATYYRLGENELMTRNFFFTKKTIPYGNIISIAESVNVINRPKTWLAPLSIVGIRIDYIKENGDPSWFFIAPQKRQEFINLLQSKIAKND